MSVRFYQLKSRNYLTGHYQKETRNDGPRDKGGLQACDKGVKSRVKGVDRWRTKDSDQRAYDEDSIIGGLVLFDFLVVNMATRTWFKYRHLIALLQAAIMLVPLKQLVTLNRPTRVDSNHIIRISLNKQTRLVIIKRNDSTNRLIPDVFSLMAFHQSVCKRHFSN